MGSVSNVLFLLLLTTALTAQSAVNRQLGEIAARPDGYDPALLETLRGTERTAFDAESGRLLAGILARPQVRGRSELIKLAGFFAGVEILDGIPAAARGGEAVRRAINLARVRAGDAERRANLLSNLRRIQIDDEFNYVVVPLLVYTRQREVFDYLFESILSENRACHPADAETAGRIDCAYRMIEQLAPAVHDFPVATDGEGNLLTDDYAAALAEVRRWYAANRATYRINTNTY